MLYTLIKDYINTPSHKLKKKKRKCYWRYYKLLHVFWFHAIFAPIGYTLWWLFKKKITYRICNGEVKFFEDLLYNYIRNPQVNRKDIINLIKRKIHNPVLYRIWLYGDMTDPLGRGGMPSDYKNGKNTFFNRFCYSAIRNRWWNGVELYFYSPEAIYARNTVDDRTTIITENYGTSNSKVGKLLRWYTTSDNEVWFVYENVYKTIVGYRDFYFGGVRGMNIPNNTMYYSNINLRFEYSNRPCKIIE